MKELYNLINWYMNDELITTNDDYLNKLISQNIVLNHNNLKFKSYKKVKKIIKISKFNKIRLSKQDKDLSFILSKIIKKFKKIKNFFRFLIHGSFGTNDYVRGWSDLDTYIIIKNNVLSDHNSLINFKKICLEIKKQLFKIDPLQHHGLIFCPQKYLNFYEYFLLPTNVLIRSKSIINKTKLTVYECKNKEHPIEHLKNLNLLLKKAFKNGYLEHHKYQNKYLLDNFADINTMYQMKYFLSIIMTLPTYYLHSIGKPVYKKIRLKLQSKISRKNGK